MKTFSTLSEIRVGVIGYGGAFNMGKDHLTRAQQAGMTPAAVADIDAKRLKEAESDFPGIQTYPTVHQMLRHADVDLVVIITPHSSHAKLVIQCLTEGKHVVCEKPLALTTAECDRMIAAAHNRKLLLSTYHNRHWDGWIIQALKTIQSGAIGEVVRVETCMGEWNKPSDWWRSSKSISGGILYDWGVHLIEYALQIIDDDIAEVNGFSCNGVWADKTVWKSDANEDEATAIVRFKKGAFLSLRITSIDVNPRPAWFEITGTAGTYIFNWNLWELIVPRRNTIVRTTGKNPADQYWQYYSNIAEHLVNNEPLVITPEWSRRPIHILDLADRSARLGRAMKAKYK